MRTNEPKNALSTTRWMVVGEDGTPIFRGMYHQENAQDEADRLNETGLRSFAPYRVVEDTERR